MSEVPPGHEDQDEWEAFAATSPSYEPLDWGSDPKDIKVCMPSSFSLHSFHQALVLPLPLRRPRLQDGSCNITNIYTLSCLICEHKNEFAFCTQCKDNRANHAGLSLQWLLDSGASAHFTFDINDFIKYTLFKKKERTAVSMAAHTVYVEGKGTILITHWENGEKVTTRLDPILFIPGLHVRLLSMGKFLQHNWLVRGDSRAIALCNTISETPYITCKPLRKGDNIFWLHAAISDVQEGQCVYTVDYETMHKHLGHPSRDVMLQIKNHCNGAPSDFEIPKQTPVCPGCAQGKMPASSHPPSETRAFAPFEHIHSNLKSFPVASYHKYKYFVSFIDDHTSYAWIVLLCDKASTIIALKQFMAMAKTQYGTDIKEWRFDAGGEYKSDAFLKTLKDAGIKILQSVPHTPQQNGRAE